MLLVFVEVGTDALNPEIFDCLCKAPQVRQWECCTEDVQLEARVIPTAMINDIVRKVDKELRKAPFCRGVISENRRECCIPKGFWETLS